MDIWSKYGICRICFRELAYKGEIPGSEERQAGKPELYMTGSYYNY
jgi:hypothetical protein